MNVGIIAGQMPYPGGGGSDPFFSSVVLLLPGADAVDLSSYGHTATVGGSVTFETSDPHPVFGTSIRTNGGGACSWLYASAPEWRYDPTFTLDFSIWFDAQAANWIPFSATDFSRFLQIVGGTGSNMGHQGKYGGASVNFAATATWYDVRIVADGASTGTFIDGALEGSGGVGVADVADKAFELLDLTANSPNYRFAGIRYTKGIARNDPGDLTCPVPSSPWPTS